MVALRHLAFAEGIDLDQEAEIRRRAEWAAKMAPELEEMRQRAAWVTDDLIAPVFG